MHWLVNRFAAGMPFTGRPPAGGRWGNHAPNIPSPAFISFDRLRFPHVASVDNSDQPPDPSGDSSRDRVLESQVESELVESSDPSDLESGGRESGGRESGGLESNNTSVATGNLDDPTDRTAARIAEREKFRISQFDVVTSLFMALILFIGVFVSMLFIIWITSRWEFAPCAIAPLIENAAGCADNAAGLERDFEPPSEEEIEELLEPTLEETINAVTDAVSSVAATAATSQSSSQSKGDSRPPGPAGEGEDIVPRFERWQLNFTVHNIAEYATQLDFYKIELGAIGGSIQGVDVATNLSGSPTSRRIVNTADEKRLYFIWTSPSPLMQFDRTLLQKANVTLQGNRQMLKFIPAELENQLANTELEYAKANGHPSVVEIAKTVFGSRSTSDGFEFEVVSQRYRKSK